MDWSYYAPKCYYCYYHGRLFNCCSLIWLAAPPFTFVLFSGYSSKATLGNAVEYLLLICTDCKVHSIENEFIVRLDNVFTLFCSLKVFFNLKVL